MDNKAHSDSKPECDANSDGSNSDAECDAKSKAYFAEIFYIPSEILGTFDVQGIKLSVWIERKEQKSLFSGQKPRMVNMIYAANAHHQLKFEADVGSDYLGYDIDKSDRLVEKIKKEYSEGKLSMWLYSYKSVCLSNDVCDNTGVYISMHATEGLPIQQILYEKRIAELETKLAESNTKLADAKLELANLADAKLAHIS